MLVLRRARNHPHHASPSERSAAQEERQRESGPSLAREQNKLTHQLCSQLFSAASYPLYGLCLVGEGGADAGTIVRAREMKGIQEASKTEQITSSGRESMESRGEEMRAKKKRSGGQAL